MSPPAFVPVGSSSFAGAAVVRRGGASSTCAPTRGQRTRTVPTAMAKKKGGSLFGLPNPFRNVSDDKKEPAPDFAAPQPGDPGYIEPEQEKFKFPESETPAGPPSKIKAKAEAEAKAKAEAERQVKPLDKPDDPPSAFKAKAKKTSLPVAEGTVEVAKKKRGLDLLREDILRSAPERIGVGRQDQTAIMAPVFGEPGYKPKAYEVANVSELGISPFPDDPNAVGKVGGLAAVEKAARLAKQGRSAKSIKIQAMNEANPLSKKVDPEDIKYDIPDYLKPLPEDTPRKGLTWKNYKGR